ncbi:NatA auxiliary subunit,N-alpha-acetyltransferase 16 [Trichinella spiralis]|uniref:NatA auxiliary subunit,N-alpha-acetyltransferase 16 n=1 Tax=Trichinella spiralis TaxID=6334 RepID=A0ABR3KB30_TRISP
MFHARDALLAESIMVRIIARGRRLPVEEEIFKIVVHCTNQHDCYCNLLNFCSKVVELYAKERKAEAYQCVRKHHQLKFAAAAAVVCLSSSNVPTERETNSLCEENQNPNQQRSSTQPICQW